MTRYITTEEAWFYRKDDGGLSSLQGEGEIRYDTEKGVYEVYAFALDTDRYRWLKATFEFFHVMKSSSKPKVGFKKLHPDAVIPKYAHKDDAGMDLVAVEGMIIPPSESRLVKTGLAIQLPPNTEAQVRPRSGLALKQSVTVLNSPGTIDRGFKGEIGVILINHGKEGYGVYKGDRIAQLVITPILHPDVVEIKSLQDSERGEGGFGSTGV